MPSEGKFHLTELTSGLQQRVIMAPFPSGGTIWHLIHLRIGGIEILEMRDGGDEVVMQYPAPVFLCMPSHNAHRIRIRAGSSGRYLAVDEIGMTSALGNKPEAVELRIMLNETLVLPLEEQEIHEVAIEEVLSTIALETETPRPGQLTIIEAQLRCLLIRLWRHSHGERAQPGVDGAQTILLRRFHQLVETHFRRRWRVSDYADALGTTPDRLHNITTKSLGRAPLLLIHERTQREAQALLTRSNMNLEQIAAYLGFSTSAQFSAFFRKRHSEPPGRFRAKFAKTSGTPEIEQVTNFTDWP